MIGRCKIATFSNPKGGAGEKAGGVEAEEDAETVEADCDRVGIGFRVARRQTRARKPQNAIQQPKVTELTASVPVENEITSPR